MSKNWSATALVGRGRKMRLEPAGNAQTNVVFGFIGLLVIAGTLAGTGCGTGSSHFVSNPPPPAKVVFAYTANNASGSISGYSVDTSTGALTVLSGFPMIIGGNPAFVLPDPSGKFLAVTDIAQDLVRIYGINTSTGALTEIAPSPYSVEQEPLAVAFDPTGKFLYIASAQMNSVTAFTMNSSGVLSSIGDSPFPTGGTIASGRGILTDPSGKFVYLVDSSNVYSFQINSSNGALTLVSTVAGLYQGDGLALDPSGSLLYAVGAGTNSIESYSINSSTGALTAAQSSPLALQNGAYTIIIDPAGKFAYTVENSEDLVAYSLSNGTFTTIANYSGALGTLQLAIDSTGTFLYAPQTGTDNNVNGFQIGASGTLSNLGTPAPAQQWPMSVTLVSE